RLTIADTGCGIPKEHRWRVFEPFFTTKAEKGTGLGLWILQGIIAKHDGVMSLRSSDAGDKSGTVVSIFLPSHTRRPRTSKPSKAESAA
ncbi:MAG TPA: HAMP domain-containing sensor histidine kinase, partial [Terriglobales bacterium]|nr:HAMP domain-containing sensor histidine kinase [Terriglobales bacterium]